MEQYIPKSALVAEIEKLESRFQSGSDEDYADGYHYSLKLVKRILNTLEVKGVDLNEEIVNQYEANYEEYLTYEEFADIAKHFYELGMKMAQKGEV